MKFFVDTADIKQIEDLMPTGLVDGVTTNPSLIAKNGDDMAETIKKICSIVSGPVSAEVTATDYNKMLEEGKYLASLAKNVAVKVPLTLDGLKTCISPFVGRLDDTGENGMALIEDIVTVYDNYGFETEVLVASIRSKQHVIDSAVIGADVATLPPKVIYELYEHPLTGKGLKAFLDDWAKTGQSILTK